MPGRRRLRRAARTGAPRRRRVRFEDTDRWARGRVLAALLAGEEPPVHGERRERALAGLERDGLVVRGPGWTLPAALNRRPIRRGSYPERSWIATRSSVGTFRPGRRGYDPAAVDEHLRRVADGFEAHAHAPPPTLSSATSEQVRQILQAAERSVSEMRARASEEASEHVARVQDAADGMLAKLDELEPELGNLLGGAARERRAAGRGPRGAPGRGSAAATARGPAPASDARRRRSPVEEDFARGRPVRADEAGARLIALNMALSGSSREETARYLADHFALDDPDALLDDVFARAGR